MKRSITALLCLTAAYGALAAPPLYTITELGSPTRGTIGSDLNANGVVVGIRYLTGFSWSDAAGYTRLRDLPGGSTSSNGLSVNDVGVSVGQSHSDLGTRATIFGPSGKAHDLGAMFPGATQSVAKSISNSGYVVGLYSSSGNGSSDSAFRWSASTGMQHIAGPGADAWYATADGVNNSGAVVGLHQTISGGSFGYVWTPEAGLYDIPDTQWAFAINDVGQVVGSADPLPASSRTGAFVWSRSAGLVRLPAPAGFAGNCSADAINSLGQIVGWCDALDAFGGWADRHAVLWLPENGQYVQTDLDLWVYPAEDRQYNACTGSNRTVLRRAVAINDGGQILVQVECLDKEFDSIVFPLHPLLLTPA